MHHKNNNGYFLKCDIKKYFQNINHKILRDQLAKVLDMDDMILVHKDKEYLKHCKEEIENYCSEKLYLQLNAKTQIGKLSKGIDFLGFRTILNENGKIIRLLRAQAKQRLRRKIKHLYKFKAQRLVDDEYVNVRLNAYYSHLCHSDALKLMHKYLNRYKNDF